MLTIMVGPTEPQPCPEEPTAETGAPDMRLWQSTNVSDVPASNAIAFSLVLVRRVVCRTLTVRRKTVPPHVHQQHRRWVMSRGLPSLS